jgi:hypothetical protein
VSNTGSGNGGTVSASGSAAYYGIRYNAAKQSNERISLGTSDLELAKEKLTSLHLKTRSANDERPEDASLADVLRRYWEARGSKVRSAKSNRHCINVWLDHLQETNVSALADVKRQEEFHKAMRDRGFSPAGIMRILNVGKAALNRAHERSELRSVPRVLTVPRGESKPMGRPLDVPELRRVYAHAVPHVQALWCGR